MFHWRCCCFRLLVASHLMKYQWELDGGGHWMLLWGCEDGFIIFVRSVCYLLLSRNPDWIVHYFLFGYISLGIVLSLQNENMTEVEILDHHLQSCASGHIPEIWTLSSGDTVCLTQFQPDWRHAPALSPFISWFNCKKFTKDQNAIRKRIRKQWRFVDNKSSLIK